MAWLLAVVAAAPPRSVSAAFTFCVREVHDGVETEAELEFDALLAKLVGLLDDCARRQARS